MRRGISKIENMGLGELSCIWDEKYQQILNLKFQFIFLSCIKKKFKCSLPGAWAVTLCSCQGPRFTRVPQTGRRGKGKDLEKVHWGHLSRKENNYTDSSDFPRGFPPHSSEPQGAGLSSFGWGNGKFQGRLRDRVLTPLPLLGSAVWQWWSPCRSGGSLPQFLLSWGQCGVSSPLGPFGLAWWLTSAQSTPRWIVPAVPQLLLLWVLLVSRENPD